MKSPVLPGSTIGVLGSGQLGRMLAMEAKRMGYRIMTYSPEANSPAGLICNKEFVGEYDDTEKLLEFAHNVDVVTIEFENVLVSALETVQSIVPAYPTPETLYIAQHRIREKNFLVAHGFPVVPYQGIYHVNELMPAIEKLGSTACVLKTVGLGYDGKGQALILSPHKALEAWEKLDPQDAILEQFMDIQMELSVIVARGINGDYDYYGPIENINEHHVLDISVCPARISPELSRLAVEMALGVAEALHVIGVVCIEFFLLTDGQLIVNELSPRPHNSGHYTIDATITSQFEQQLRMICGLPLGSTKQLVSAGMANIFGDLWEKGDPQWYTVLEVPDIKLHLYEKSAPKKNRKMGHLTALGLNSDIVYEKVLQARDALTQV